MTSDKQKFVPTLYVIMEKNKIFLLNKNISEDTQELAQSQSTAFPRHQMKERWGTNNDKTSATCFVFPMQYYIGYLKDIEEKCSGYYIALDKVLFQPKIFFLFLHKNHMLWYSLEASLCNEYPQHIFSWRNNKKYLPGFPSYLKLFRRYLTIVC